MSVSLDGYVLTINGVEHNMDDYAKCACNGKPLGPDWLVGPERVHEAALAVWRSLSSGVTND